MISMYRARPQKIADENIHLFDCRRYIAKGDQITFRCDLKEAELFEGVAKCVDAHEQFIRIQCENVIQTINRWHILLVNGHKVTTGGCFANVPTLEERGLKLGRAKGIHNGRDIETRYFR